ncbi:hypothetical protein BRD17_01410 [Halobacteriales archaeon SW_7_68_16]|nr:MAG: hypothetical protein BRD17_01410 [Halobacteriales archaeon SW_7_68_16]
MAGSLDDIRISATAREKRERYLSPNQLRTVLRSRTGYVCRKASPTHEGLYDDNRFLLRGTFFDVDLDIVFVVADGHATVVTQMSQHATSVRGRFYEYVGESAADAVATLE